MTSDPVYGHVMSRRLRINYVQWGSPDAPLLVLVHGGLENARVWDQVARDLAADWRVVAIDQRGHGDSDWATGGGYATLDFVSDLKVLTDHLGGPPFVLVGHSLGGHVSIHFTAAFPERVSRLCVIEGLGYGPTIRAKKLETPRPQQMRNWVDQIMVISQRAPRPYASVEDAARRIMQYDTHVDFDTACHIARHNLKPAPAGGFIWKYDEELRALQHQPLGLDPGDLWAAIPCPVLLVYGAESWASNPATDGRARHFQNARVQTVAGAGHNVQHHKPQEFLRALRNFLQQTA